MKLVVKAKLCAAILFLMPFAICSGASSAERKPERVDCDVHAGPCNATLKDIQVTLDIKPKPHQATPLPPSNPPEATNRDPPRGTHLSLPPLAQPRRGPTHPPVPSRKAVRPT